MRAQHHRLRLLCTVHVPHSIRNINRPVHLVVNRLSTRLLGPTPRCGPCLTLTSQCPPTAYPWPSTAFSLPFLDLPLPFHCLQVVADLVQYDLVVDNSIFTVKADKMGLKTLKNVVSGMNYARPEELEGVEALASLNKWINRGVRMKGVLPPGTPNQQASFTSRCFV